MPSALPEQLTPTDDDGFDPDRLLEVFDAHRVEYVLVGGFAARIHGATRRTADLDCVPHTSLAHYDRLAAVRGHHGHRSHRASRRRPGVVRQRCQDQRRPTRRRTPHPHHWHGEWNYTINAQPDPS